MLVCIAVAAPELLRDIYGGKWIPAAMPMRILCRGPDRGRTARRNGSGLLRQGPSIDGRIPSQFAPRPDRGRNFFGRARRAGGRGSAMSLIELTISGLGQLVACGMVKTTFSSVAPAVAPSFKTAARLRGRDADRQDAVRQPATPRIGSAGRDGAAGGLGFRVAGSRHRPRTGGNALGQCGASDSPRHKENELEYFSSEISIRRQADNW